MFSRQQTLWVSARGSSPIATVTKPTQTPHFRFLSVFVVAPPLSKPFNRAEEVEERRTFVVLVQNICA